MRSALSTLLPAVLMVLVAVANSGCTSCEPLLEARNCLDSQCVPSDDAVTITWSAEDARKWPQVDAMLRGLEPGEHDHMAWSNEPSNAILAHYGVEGDEPELIIHLDEERLRVRVLGCD